MNAGVFHLLAEQLGLVQSLCAESSVFVHVDQHRRPNSGAGERKLSTVASPELLDAEVTTNLP
jgi:hypothetical protein